MNKIIFKGKCQYKGKIYKIGDELKGYKKEDAEAIRRLNEKGFIQPLTQSQLSAIKNGTFSKKNESEEEINNG